MNGLVNMYRGRDALRFEDADYERYRNTIDRIRRRIMHHFGLEHLYFTAPTFITQLVGDQNWAPKSIHGEGARPVTLPSPRPSRAAWAQTSTGMCTLIATTPRTTTTAGFST